MRNALVLLNAYAGSLRQVRAVLEARERLRRWAPGAEIVIAGRPEELAPALQRAKTSPAEYIFVGGGDGTLRGVAESIAGTGKVLGVLPLGTVNHFARRLGLPLGLGAALSALEAARPSILGAGEVNGRLFLNNSTLGLYPRVVRARDHLRHRCSLAKWPALARAGARALARPERAWLELVGDEGALTLRSPFVFVTNHDYLLGALPLLPGGVGPDELGVCAAPAETPAARLGLLARIATGTLAACPSLRAFRTRSLAARGARPRLHVTLDGEVLTLESPLVYRPRPGVLRVLAPRGAPAPAPALSTP
ncbi:MAG TPA: diacylglycerol kinase family protein [Polyangiaceae bacterium]|nr:diacylglycerol kinase family protein [Polyangiaceae bacterium]